MVDQGSRSQLESQAISQRWQEVSGPLARLVAWMDSKEGWVIDADSEFLDLLSQVVDKINDPEFAKVLERGENAARMAEVFAMLSSSRFIRVLEMFDRRNPGVVNRLTYALGVLGGKSEQFANLYYERLLVIHKCEVLGQIFSVKRSQLIADAIMAIKETRDEAIA